MCPSCIIITMLWYMPVLHTMTISFSLECFPILDWMNGPDTPLFWPKISYSAPSKMVSRTFAQELLFLNYAIEIIRKRRSLQWHFSSSEAGPQNRVCHLFWHRFGFVCNSKEQSYRQYFTVSYTQRSLKLAMWLRMNFELLTRLPSPP